MTWAIENGRRGFSLVEVLAASVLLGSGVAGLMYAASLSLRNQEQADLRAGALYLAQEKLAELELVGPSVFAQSGATEGNETRGKADYAWSVSTQQGSIGKLHRVVVTVSWTSGQHGGEVELETWLNDLQSMAAANSETATGSNVKPNP